MTETNQRFEMLPIFLKLEGRQCLVVGAGKIAAPKIASLLRAGGTVTVVAPAALPEVAARAKDGELQWRAREFEDADLDSVDDPPDCDFFYPSVVRRGDLQIAISTSGKSPALAQRLRAEIEGLLDEGTGAWLDRLGETRLRILEAYPLATERKEALHQLARRESCDAESCPVQKTLDRLIGAAPPRTEPAVARRSNR